MAEYSKTVDQALRVLMSLHEDGPATVSELAERIQVNRTGVHRVIATLAHRGFCRRGEDGRWALGLALLDCAADVESQLRRCARPVLDDLAERFGETAVLSIRDKDEVVAIEQGVGVRHPVQVTYRIGTRHPLTRGAHARVLLASAAPTERERLLAADPHSPTTQQQLEKIRRDGFAISHDELQFGASGLAVPVRGENGQVIASLGVVAPVGRLPADDELLPAVLGASERLSERLGGARRV